MDERNGVRIGQRVRGAGGEDLGRVTDLYEWGFAAARGLPVLFRREWVARYDEVRGVRDGALVLGRSDGDLTALALGGVAPSWRVAAPPHFPAAATPAEALGLLEQIASGAVGAAPPEPWPPEPPPAPLGATPPPEVPGAPRRPGPGAEPRAEVE